MFFFLTAQRWLLLKNQFSKKCPWTKKKSSQSCSFYYVQSSLAEQRRVPDNCLTAFGKSKNKEQVVVIMGKVLSARIEALSEVFSFLSWCKILAWSLKSGFACSKNDIC